MPSSVFGIVATAHNRSGNPNVITIEANMPKQKGVNDALVFKPALLQGKKALIRNNITAKMPDITPRDLCDLAEMSTSLEDQHKKRLRIEWEKDLVKNKISIRNVAPLNEESTREKYRTYTLQGKGPFLLKGITIGRAIVSGKVKIIESQKDYKKVLKGDIVVTKEFSSNLETLFEKASAIICEQESMASLYVQRTQEAGTLVIVGARHARKKLRENQQITIDCSHGEEAYVYGGLLSYTITEENPYLYSTRTAIKLAVEDAAEAFDLARLPSAGVGLLRLEHIITKEIGIHPLALLNYEAIRKKNKHIATRIAQQTEDYPNKTDFFINKVAENIGIIAAAFYPRRVTVRFSDLATNEYKQLIAGSLYEINEENPLVGWRGVSRYYKQPYENAFRLECRAIRKVREDFGLTNIDLLIPFCRSPDEARKTLDILVEEGLQRSSGLAITLMCEVPSNVILADKFLELVDGYAIGSNDLTQLTYGVDRKVKDLHDIASEHGLAVKRMIGHAIKMCKKMGKPMNICGDAVSLFKDFAEFVVEHETETITVSPHVFFIVRKIVAEKEKNMHITPSLFSKLKMN